MYTANFAIPLVGTWAMGGASIAMFYIYLIGFDVLNAIGHCNFEFIPRWFMRLPGMKYLIYTPSYHSRITRACTQTFASSCRCTTTRTARRT